MIQMLVVDDEEIIVEGIARSIDWSEYGIDHVFEAYSGKSALEVLENEQIDIILTDIRMPEISGLEIVEVATGMNRDIICVLMSAYQDFSYAQKAMSFGVTTYVTKPIKRQLLIESISKAVMEVNSKRKRQDKLNNYDDLYKQNSLLTKERYIVNLIEGKVKERVHSVEILNKYDMNLYNHNFGIMIIQNIPDLDRSKVDERSISLWRKNTLDILKKMELRHYKFEILDNYHNNILILFSIDSLCKIDEVYDQIGDIIMKEIHTYLKKDIVIGVGYIYEDIMDMHISYQEAQVALEYRNSSERNIVVYYDKLSLDDMETTFVSREVSECMNRIFDEIGKTDMDNLVDLLGSVREKAGDELPFIYMKQVYMQLLSRIIWLLMENQISLNKVFGESASLFEGIFAMSNIDEIEDWIAYVLEVVNSHLNQSDQYSEPILQALKYINQNFCSDISMVEVAENVKLNPSYFSKLYKKEVGLSFTKSLNVMRINKAKELLTNSNMKIYEISDALGYQSQQYFTNLFKSIVGCTPNEYRRIL